MRAANATMIALLGSAQQILMADLLTINLVGGTVLRMTSSDIDITYGGNTFSSTGLAFKRGKTRTIIGVEVDQMSLTLYGNTSTLIGGIPFLQAMRSGLMDGAYVYLERALMSTWGDTTPGTIKVFSGRVSEITSITRTYADIAVSSDLELLNIQFPRNVWQPGCLNSLYDSQCAVSRVAMRSSYTATGGTIISITESGAAQAAGYFDLGYVTFTSGVNSGQTRTVKSYTPGTWTLISPLLSAPANGDTFYAFPGCDKQQATCAAKFTNIARFRGFPYIPSPDSLT